MKVNIVFPVLNEERRLEKGIIRTMEYLMSHKKIDAIITIVDNGSTDTTLDIIKELALKYSNIRYISLKEKGFGLAFREAVINNDCDIIGYVDVDLSTDISYLGKVLTVFKNNSDVSIVKGNRLAKSSQVNGRKLSRNITSNGLDILIKAVFGVKVSDTMEGFQFFRKSCIERLIAVSSKDNGWFYCAELLIRAEKMGYGIVEMPVEWFDDYDTKVDVMKLIINYLTKITQLRLALIMEKYNIE